MKSTLRLLCLVFIFAANSAFSQSLENYFESKGVYNLCDAAHPSNDFIDGSYDIHTDYVDVFLTSKDNVFGGNVYTNLRLVRGGAGLFFTDIITLKETDFTKPFDAFGLQAALLTACIKGIDAQAYSQMRTAVQKNFGTDFEHWTGKMWAILAMNFDYYEFALKN